MKAVLIREFGTNQVLVRVYDKNFEFVDYELLHPDLEIDITDKDFALYSVGDRNYIDIKQG